MQKQKKNDTNSQLAFFLQNFEACDYKFLCVFLRYATKARRAEMSTAPIPFLQSIPPVLFPSTDQSCEVLVHRHSVNVCYKPGIPATTTSWWSSQGKGMDSTSFRPPPFPAKRKLGAPPPPRVCSLEVFSGRQRSATRQSKKIRAKLQVLPVLSKPQLNCNHCEVTSLN